MMPSGCRTRCLRRVLALALCLLGALVAEAAERATKAFDVPGGDAVITLKQFSRQAGVQLIYMVDQVRGVRTQAVRGRFTPEEALNLMLSHTGFVVIEDDRTDALAIARSRETEAGKGGPDRASLEPARSATAAPAGVRVPDPSSPARSDGSRRASQNPEPETPVNHVPMKKNLLTRIAATFALLLSPLTQAAESPGGETPVRTLTGQVTNAASGLHLNGARVELQGTGQRTTTDEAGRYIIAAPAGDVTLVVSYPGLDTVTLPLRMTDRASLTQNVQLTSDIYRMDVFTVEGERESSAMAAALQRQAANVKNVVATDAFGTMTEDNVGAFLQKVPGIVASDTSGSGVRAVMIRGIDADLNTVEMDGIQMANNNSTGTNRAFDFFQASLSLIETIEVTKAPTPDRPANSIGGSINMVTRSAFNRNAPRQFRYSLGFSHALNRKGGRAERQIDEPIDDFTPTVTFAYSDVFGREKNLGLSLSYSRSSNMVGSTDTEQNYQATLNRSAYIYRTFLRQQHVGGPAVRQNIGLKGEYKLSERSTFTLNATHNFHLEPVYFVSMNLATTNNASQMRPGYSDTYTEVIPSASAVSTISSVGYDNFTNNYQFHGKGLHRLEGLTLDYIGTLSLSNAYQNYSPQERQYEHGRRAKGNITARLTNVGWITDRRSDDTYPTITQTAGRDMWDINNYAIASMTQNNRIAESSIVEGRVNMKKDFSLPVPAYIKAGLQYQKQKRRKQYHYHSYTFSGAGGLEQFADRSGWTQGTLEGMRQPEWLDLYRTAQHKEDNPAQWTESIQHQVRNGLQNDQNFREEVTAAYVMGNVRLGDLGIMAGLRIEETETFGEGPLQYLSPEERARRAAWTGALTNEEIVRREIAEYGNRTTGAGKYRNVFPGVYFTYSAPTGLVTRLSYSTSIGRPPISSIIPVTNVNDANRTLSVANIGLKPQFSDNFDLNVEYYFKSIGFVSASVFLKEVDDFIYSTNNVLVPAGPDNGFDGEYAGYLLSTQRNGGRARYRGFELSYQQQFTFLPGLWRGFGFNANYTQLETRGDYGGTSATTEVAGFRPKTANASINYQRGKYRASLQGNWVDAYLVTISADPALVVRELPKTTLNFKFSYDLNRNTTVYFNADNLLRTYINERYYGGLEDRKGFTRLPYRSIAFGVQGRF